LTNSTTASLGQDAFLKLLVTQLQHQDPTKPMDDTTFIAQLATFSSLEKLTSIDNSLKSLSQLFGLQAERVATEGEK
jgi:flagellar basal-body rod modification protein FlgD